MPSVEALALPATHSTKLLQVDVGLKLITRAAQQATVALNGTVIPEDAVYIEGYASTPAVDRYREIVAVDAFEKGIENYLKNPIILFAHDDKQPIGLAVSVSIEDGGLHVRCAIVDEQKKALIKAGVLRAFSIGFLVKEVVDNPNTGVPTITKLDLAEISVVAVPANQDALFSPVKSWKKAWKSFLERTTDPSEDSSLSTMPTPETEAQLDAPVTTPASETSETPATDSVVAEVKDAPVSDNAAAPAEVEATESAEAPAEVVAADTESAPVIEAPAEVIEDAPIAPEVVVEAEAPVVESAVLASPIEAVKSILKEETPVAEAVAEQAADAVIETKDAPVASVRIADLEEVKSAFSEINEAFSFLATEIKSIKSTIAAQSAVIAEQDAILAKMPARKALVNATPATFLSEGEKEGPKTMTLKDAMLALRS